MIQIYVNNIPIAPIQSIDIINQQINAFRILINCENVDSLFLENMDDKVIIEPNNSIPFNIHSHNHIFQNCKFQQIHNVYFSQNFVVIESAIIQFQNEY